MRRILSWLLNRTFLEVLALAIAAALIWYVGDAIAFGTVHPWRPLEPSAVRLTLIGLIFATWLGLRLWRWWRSHKANAALLSQLAKDDRPAGVPESARGAEEVAELRKRFESALATLKKSGSSSGQSGLFSRLSRQYVYQMPWYLFIGAPGSGKTTALVNSGLEFPLADKFGKASIRGVGGTRNCDWWFTNEAVLIDTAGRYTTQESNLQLDRTEWEGFLALLRKYRPRAPINGVILAISVSDLLGSNQDEREQHAAAIRRRLTELQDQLGVRVPVYAIVTKVDLLAGFNEYFGRLTQEERAQIWGLTFPANEEGEPTKDLAATFQAEYRLLERRIEDALPDLLQSEPDVQRRALVYAFTQQFAGLRDVLGQFLATLFSESKFAQPPIVRGVYFTSGTQEGTPFDRVLGSIQRRFGVQARVQAVASAQGTGKSYFLRDLLQKLVFAEAHLVGRNPARERRRRVQRLAGIAACVVVLIGAAIAWTISFSNNRAYLAEVAPRVDQLKAEVQATANAPGDYVALLPILNHAHDLAMSERFPVDSPPLSYRWGLYQGSGVQAKADPVYEKLLEGLLLPRVALRLKQLLKDAPPDDLEIQYGRLKAYLMLHDPAHYDPKFLMDAVSRDWQSTAGQNLPREAGEQLTGHLRRLLDGGQVRKTTEEKDNVLVARVRQQLGRYTPEKRLYGKLKVELVAKGLADFTLLSVVGADANSVFVRASGKLLDEGILGVYTRAGYEALQQRLNDRRLGVLVENWVLGGSERSASAAMDDVANNRLATEIRKLYLAEYQKTWDVFLSDVRLIAQQDLDRLVSFVGYLAAPDSPLFRFTEAVAKETKLSDVGQRTAGLADQITDATKEKLGAAVQRLSGGTSLQLRESGADSTRAGQIERQYVDIPFERWQRLAAPSASGSGEGLRSLLSLLQSTLQSVQIARRSSAPMPPDTNFTRIRGDAQRLPPPLREMVEGLASSTSSQAADTVRRSVGAQLGAGVADSCRNAIKGRYPFDRNGRDVLLDDFVQIFRAGGSLDEHFQKNLASQVDQSKKPWAFRNPVDNSSIGGAAMLLPFQNAAAIREAFFRGPGGALQFQASIRVLDMDPSIKELTLDVGGQSMKYVRSEPGRSKNFVWPPPGGSVQVRLQPDGGAPLSFDGPWALHHLFDKAAITQGGGPEQFTAALSVGGRPITLDVIAGSVRNPFRLRELDTFACPGPQ